MKIISKILILLVCMLCWANPADAEYQEKACGAGNTCQDGWKQYTSGTECVCFTCTDDDCNAEEGAMKGCHPLPAKLHEAQECIFCPLFKALYEAVRTISTEAFNATKDPIRNVMLYGFAIYIAFGVLKLVSSLTKQDAPKYISGLLVDTCKFVVAFLLLQNADSIYYYIINPLLSTSLDFGGAMLFSAGDAISTCKADSNAIGSGSSAILPESLYTSLECFIKGVQSEIAFAQAAGSSIMCISVNEGASWNIPDFSMFFSGLFIYVVALLLSFAFGFYLIDSIVMLGIIGALMTFFIACWPFKLTGGYTGKGFGMFMNVFFNFVFMGIVVSVNTQLIKASLATGGLENLEAVLMNNNIKDTKEILDITGMGFLVIACCCFFGFKFTAKSASLASSMAGGGGIDIGSKLGTLLTSGAVNSGLAVGKSAVMPTVNKVWGAAKDAGNKALEVTGDAIFHPMKSARKAQGVLTKRFGQAQKTVGAAKGIVGNLKGDADMVQKGKELYDKGGVNVERGQRRIDRENAGLHPERQQSAPDYSKFDGNGGSDEKNTPSTANNSGTNERIQQLEQEKAMLIQELEKAIAEGNITAEQKAELERKLQDKQQELENKISDAEQKIQDAQQHAVGSGGSGGSAYREAKNQYDNNYQNVQPKTIEECGKLMEQAKREYQQNIDNYKNNMNASMSAINENLKAQLEMKTAKNKMDIATNPTDYNNAHMQYLKAGKKFNETGDEARKYNDIANNYRNASLTNVMAYAKYQYAEEQMKEGNNVNWKAAHDAGINNISNINILSSIETTGPRNG